MTTPKSPEKSTPADQAGEEHGSIDQRQRHERDMIDTARGSEPATRGSSGRRN